VRPIKALRFSVHPVVLFSCQHLALGAVY